MQRIIELKELIENIAKQQMEMRFMPANDKKSSFPTEVRVLRKRMALAKKELSSLRGVK